MEEEDEPCRLHSKSACEESDEQQIILESPDLETVKTISQYFQASLNGQKHMLSHPVSDHEFSAESDSGDSLFITQAPVPLAVRSIRRRHLKDKSDLPCSIESEEETHAENGSVSPQSEQHVLPAEKHHKWKAKKPGLKEYSFPFIEKVYRGKKLSSRERAYRNQHLPQPKSVTLSSSAIGGFFRCVNSLKKFSKGRVTLASTLPNRHLDEDSELSPLSEQEKECEDGDDDISVVDNYIFIPFLKKINRQAWHQPLSDASKDSSTKIQEQSKEKTQDLPSVKEDKPSKQRSSLRGKAEKERKARMKTNSKSERCFRRRSTCRSRNETDAEEPEVHVADIIDAQEDNDNRDILLTDWETVTNLALVSEEADISRKDPDRETSSPNNEMQASDRRHPTQNREPGIKDHQLPLPDLATLNYCTNVALGGEGQSIDERVGQPPCPDVPMDQDLVRCVSTDAIPAGEASEICQNNMVDHSVSGEIIIPRKKKRKERRQSSHLNDEEMVTRTDQNAKLSFCGEEGAIVLRDDKQPKKKKKKGKSYIAHGTPEKKNVHELSPESHLDEAIEFENEKSISIPPLYDDTNLQQNTEICQKKTESSIVQFAELVAQKKKKKKKKKHKTIEDREGSLAESNSTVSPLKKKKSRKDGNSFCSDESAGSYSETMPQTTSILYPFDEINGLKKMRKNEENTLHTTSKVKADEIEDMITKKSEKRKYSHADYTAVELQEDNAEQHIDTPRSAVSESIDTFPQRKKKKTKRKDLTTPLNTSEIHQKDHSPSLNLTLVSVTDDITSLRKSMSKRERNKNNCSGICEDTAAPLNKGSDVLEEWKNSVSTPVDIVSLRKSKKNNKSGTHVEPMERPKHDAVQLPQRISTAAQNPSLEERSYNLDMMEVRVEEASSFISSHGKKMKTKNKNSEGHPDNYCSTMLSDVIQGSVIQYNETSRSAKRIKEKRTKNKSVAPQGTESGEIMSERMMSDYLPSPLINIDPVSTSNQLFSKVKKKKKKLYDAKEDFFTTVLYNT